VRLQMELRSRIYPTARCGKFRTCERESPQARGTESGSNALTEANEKVTPTKIDGCARLPCPVQSDVPRKVTCGTETNIRVSTGQGKRRNSLT
jgi:hypothetical protein